MQATVDGWMQACTTRENGIWLRLWCGGTGRKEWGGGCVCVGGGGGVEGLSYTQKSVKYGEPRKSSLVRKNGRRKVLRFGVGEEVMWQKDKGVHPKLYGNYSCSRPSIGKKSCQASSTISLTILDKITYESRSWRQHWKKWRWVRITITCIQINTLHRVYRLPSWYPRSFCCRTQELRCDILPFWCSWPLWYPSTKTAGAGTRRFCSQVQTSTFTFWFIWAT